ncbi:PQQ-binding-like beta-propeller repeat protein, partial [Candidatus Bathyarchaeota archaeon]|nr:PQQ-binding-like beta-propeller repeat protein [Candidatus Bathyarchaeota archaeon]
GTEFYVSPTFADGKLYVTSDQRGVYVLNATDGSKLSFYGTSSNSWSSSTLYAGKLYVGCNDWNVYCLAEAPALVSNLTIKPDKTNLTLGGSVNVSGCLVPGMTNQSILVTFVRPDGSMDDMQVATVGRGLFNCVYTPNLSGTWVVTAQWNSTIGIYSSAYSEYVPIEVTLAPTPTPTPTPPAPKTLPLEYIIAIAASIVVILLPLAYFFKRKSRKK